MNCDKCEHFKHMGSSLYGGTPFKECAITKCPLVLRDEILDKVDALVVHDFKCRYCDDGLKLRDAIRALRKGEPK